MAANPRAAAVAALVRQEQDGFSNLVLDAELRRQKLEGRDKAFAGAIFYTVLEHQGTLDFILEQFLPKGLARLDPQVREILRAALAQARYMQVPVSAAVNEAVKLTRTFKKASASGLVNAVLRKACNYDLETARFRNETQHHQPLGLIPEPGGAQVVGAGAAQHGIDQPRCAGFSERTGQLDRLIDGRRCGHLHIPGLGQSGA